MRVKIISDGTVAGSQITTEDGTIIEGVTNVVISMNAKKPLVLATLYIQAPILELTVPEEQVNQVL